MNWEKIEITLDDKSKALAQAPVIISASRSTDIPAFYADWFFYRLNVGYSSWKNPFNNEKSYISYKNTRLIVFWSKNPKPLFNYLDELKIKEINCYLQFTLNDYENEGLEKGIPSLQNRIDTFKKISDTLGKGKVIWRFDPLILTNKIRIDDLLLKIRNIGEQIKDYNEKLVFSFADIDVYRKVKNNLNRNDINYIDFTDSDVKLFSKGISELNNDWNFELATCCEEFNLNEFNIKPNRCIDDDLMIKYFSHDKALMDFIGVEFTEPDIFDQETRIIKKKNNKDKGQRKFCGCISSKDIGEYNTCPHQCEYCYANASKNLAKTNFDKHLTERFAETITGKI